MKTFITIGHSGKYEDSDQSILYVGNDEDKAFSVKTDEYYHSLSIEFWVNEQKIKGWYNGEKEYDKTEELIRQINQNKSILENAEIELASLKEYS